MRRMFDRLENNYMDRLVTALDLPRVRDLVTTPG